MSNQINTYRILNIIGLVLVILMNYLANALPINGMNTGEISALYPNYFVPAGFTFSIWGLIYLLLLGFIIYQSRGWWGNQQDSGWIRAIGNLFFYNCLLNAAWIIAWHYLQPLIALGLMLLLLFTLITIHSRLRAPEASGMPGLVKVAFSIYLGWISVATIANTTAVLVYFKLTPPLFNEPQWAGIMILVASVLGAYFALQKKDYPFAGVVLWALVGIYAARMNTGEMTSFILSSIIIGAILLVLSIIYKIIRSGSIRMG